MSDKMIESLSALVDGEADELELRRTINLLSEDTELRGKWERYHMIGSVLRNQPQIDQSRMKEGIWAALDLSDERPDETILISSPVDEDSVVGGWGGYIGKFAVAATVAVAVIVGVDMADDSARDSVPQVAEINILNDNSDTQGLETAETQSTKLVTQQTTAGFVESASGLGEPLQSASMGILSKHPTQDDMQRANAYVLHHSQYTAINKHPSMVPFVKMASFDNK